MTNFTKILCVGGCHEDWQMRLKAPLVKGESNPVSTQMRKGGVAHNVHATLLSQSCKSNLLSLPPDPSRSYLAIEAEDGTLLHGLASLDTYENLDADFISANLGAFSEASWIVADANCQPDAIGRLPKDKSLALIAVSPAKMSHFLPALDHADILFCNTAEYRKLLELSAHKLPANLMILETRGEHGCRLHQYDKSPLDFTSPQSASPSEYDPTYRDATGLGDCLAGLIIAGLAKAVPIEHAIEKAYLQFPNSLAALRRNQD